MTPGSERSPGEGIGYPLQYSWASLVAQLVKNTPTMWMTWIRSLGWEDPLEKGKATHSSILAERIPWSIKSIESQRVRHDWATFTFTLEICGQKPTMKEDCLLPLGSWQGYLATLCLNIFICRMGMIISF